MHVLARSGASSSLDKVPVLELLALPLLPLSAGVLLHAANRRKASITRSPRAKVTTMFLLL
jgi:hypothetical protein